MELVRLWEVVPELGEHLERDAPLGGLEWSPEFGTAPPKHAPISARAIEQPDITHAMGPGSDGVGGSDRGATEKNNVGAVANCAETSYEVYEVYEIIEVYEVYAVYEVYGRRNRERTVGPPRSRAIMLAPHVH